MFRPNRPSSGVQVVVIKVSAAHYKAVLFLLYGGESITLAARSKACNVFARSNTGIVGSNLTQGMDVCLRLICVCVVLHS
jgi:hypothetical protein